MRTLIKACFSLSVIRNILFVSFCVFAFMLAGRRSSANIVYGSGSCHDITIGPATAFCLSAGECQWPFDYMTVGVCHDVEQHRLP